MDHVVELSSISIDGLFGDVSFNNYTSTHSEIATISSAYENIKDFKLEDCAIYNSCEPCPLIYMMN